MVGLFFEPSSDKVSFCGERKPVVFNDGLRPGDDVLLGFVGADVSVVYGYCSVYHPWNLLGGKSAFKLSKNHAV